MNTTTSKQYHTRGVLGGAYKGKSVGTRALLTHDVEVDAEGFEIKVSCRGVQLDHIVDQSADPEGHDKPPTCPRCLQKWQKRQGTPTP